MKEFIRRLQQKPEKVREQIALLAAGGVTLLIVVVWVFSLSNRFTPATVVAEDGSAVAPEKPFSVLFDSLKETFATQTDQDPTDQQQTQATPFSYDESNSYQGVTNASDAAPVQQQTLPADTMQPSVLSIDTTDTTTETPNSKDQTTW